MTSSIWCAPPSANPTCSSAAINLRQCPQGYVSQDQVLIYGHPQQAIAGAAGDMRQCVHLPARQVALRHLHRDHGVAGLLLLANVGFKPALVSRPGMSVRSAFTAPEAVRRPSQAVVVMIENHQSRPGPLPVSQCRHWPGCPGNSSRSLPSPTPSHARERQTSIAPCSCSCGSRGY